MNAPHQIDVRDMLAVIGDQELKLRLAQTTIAGQNQRIAELEAQLAELTTDTTTKEVQ
jgi:hypothetical protein